MRATKRSLQEASAVTDVARTIEAGRVMSRALASATSANARLDLARSFGYQLVASWWANLTANDGGSLPLRTPIECFAIRKLPKSAQALAESLGASIAALEPEHGAYQIGRAYTGMLPPEHRSTHGIYYTPPALTARLLDQATLAGTDWATARVLDPACGGGAFLAPVARRIIDALPDCTPSILLRNIGSRLRGYELDPFGAWLSQVTLDAMVLPLTRVAGKVLPVIVSVCDSLQRTAPRDRFDLVVGNPPYGRVTLPPEDRQRFKRSLYGHANLYGLFTDLALRHTKQGGVIAYVTPTSFLAGEYFKNLRALLGSSAPPVTIDFVSTRRGVFDDVLQETLLATYRRGAASVPAAIHELVPQDDGAVEVQAVGEGTLPIDCSQPWLLPRTKGQRDLLRVLITMTHRLADWGYTVSTGPLVWNRFKTQLAEHAGRDRLPLIWAEAITNDGRFEFRAEKKNHAPYFELRGRDSFLAVRSPCVLLQRTTAKEQARRLIAAELPADFLAKHGAVVVENHLNIIRPVGADPVIPVSVIAAFLNSQAADRVFRCVSGSVAVSAYELEAMPLPAPEELVHLSRLVANRAGKAAIEAECARLYREPAK